MRLLKGERALHMRNEKVDKRKAGTQGFVYALTLETGPNCPCSHAVAPWRLNQLNSFM